VNKYLHTVASVGFLFTLNYDARNHELNIYIYFIYIIYYIYYIYIFPSNAPHVLYGLRGLPSWAWQKCNRLLRLERP